MSLDEPMRIGSISADPGLLLAPMEDVSDLPFRTICKELGADIVYTEFVNAEGLVRQPPVEHRRRGSDKLLFRDAERPLGIQLYGASEFSMETAAHTAAQRRPDLIDINCGCWVSNVALRGAGAGLLRDPDQMRKVVERVIGAVGDLPVTVKTRLGWDPASIHIVEVARMLEEAGVRALALHCRTRSQGHKGVVDYSWIPRIKEVVSIPVIANGDITTSQDVARVFAATGCDGVMIGRAAVRHPWIFRDARSYLQTGRLAPPPTLAERANLCLKHLRLSVELRGDRGGVIGMRRHFAGYFRGMRGAAQLRGELTRLAEAESVRQRLQQLAESPQAEVPVIPDPPGAPEAATPFTGESALADHRA